MLKREQNENSSFIHLSPPLHPFISPSYRTTECIIIPRALCSLRNPLLSHPNTDYFKQGRAPLPLYIISPFLPLPAQSVPSDLSFSIGGKIQMRLAVSSPPFSPLSKQSSFCSAQRHLCESHAHTGDHNKIM